MTQTAGITNIQAQVRGVLPSLTPAERRVGEAVLADPAGTVRLTISELAERCRTSLTTVTRFCRALGLSGYPELRLALATDAGEVRSRNWVLGADAEIGPDDPLPRVLANLLATDVRALEETAAQLDVGVAERVVQALDEARRIDIYAVSGSGAVGQDLQRRLHLIECVCHLWSDVHDALASAALLTESDVAVGISHSGETREVVEPLALARENGATTVAITNFPRSAISSAADLMLTTAARETTYRSGGLSGRHTQLLVVDCLVTGVAQRRSSVTESVAKTSKAVRPHRIKKSREGD